MPQNIWTILITHAAVQGVLLAILLLAVRRGNRRARRALALLLLVLSGLTFNFLMEYFQWYESAPHLIWVAAPLWYVAGPLLLLFAQYATRKGFRFRWKYILHFLPAFGAIIYIGRFYGLSAENKLTVFRQFYSPEQFPQHDLYFYGYMLLLAIYAYLAYREFSRYFRRVGEEIAQASAYEFKWVSGLMLSIEAFVLASLGYNFLLQYDFEYFIEADFVTFLILSVSIQAIGIFALLHPRRMFATPLERKKETIATTDSDDTERLEALAREAIEFIRLEKPHLNPGLRLSNLALALGVPDYLLSQAINQQLGKNFYELINSFRVEEVKNCLKDQQYQRYTLLAIAQRCGFNSSASFYRIFKQQAGMTPREYKSLIEKRTQGVAVEKGR